MMMSLNESNVPKAVFTPGLEIDSSENCLGVLHRKFKFAITAKLKVSCFQLLKQSLTAFLEIEYPLLISIESKLATYHHMVVIWREMAIDCESMFMFVETNVWY
jgi:hypothetical protein